MAFYTLNPNTFFDPFKLPNEENRLLDATIVLNELTLINNKLILWLKKTRCLSLHLFLEDNLNLKLINLFLEELTKLTSIQNITISINYTDFITKNLLKEWMVRFPFVGRVLIYDTKSLAAKELSENKELYPFPFYFLSGKWNINKIKAVDLQSFVINSKFYSLSLTKNNSHFGHLFIDQNGIIYNDEYHQTVIGSINHTHLEELLINPSFTKYWDINKDKIHVCKDCEFRYICADCRAYLEDPEDIYSKPLKCGYNPYTGEWSEWSTNPLKQKAIDFYGMREMVDGMNKNDDNPSSNNKTS